MATPVGSLDLRLQGGSVCEDAGDLALLPADELDLDGDMDPAEDLPLDLTESARVAGGEVDMGAYETNAVERLPTDSAGSAAQRLSGSVAQRLSGSAAQRLSGRAAILSRLEDSA